MNFDRIKEKLEILADAAKYDVSCSSSGGNRKNKGGLGNSHTAGICHSYTEDGRCISLLNSAVYKVEFVHDGVCRRNQPQKRLQ